MTQLWRALEPLWQWSATSSWLLAALLALLLLRGIVAVAKWRWEAEYRPIAEEQQRRCDRTCAKLDRMIEDIAAIRSMVDRILLETSPKATVRGGGLPVITSGAGTLSETPRVASGD